MNFYNQKLLIKFAKAAKCRDLMFIQRETTHGWLTDGHAAYRVNGGFSELPDAVRALFPVKQIFVPGVPLMYRWHHSYTEVTDGAVLDPERLESLFGSAKLRVEERWFNVDGEQRRLWEFDTHSRSTWGFWQVVAEDVAEPAHLIVGKAFTDVLEGPEGAGLVRSIGSNDSLAVLRWYDPEGVLVGLVMGIRP